MKKPTNHLKNMGICFNEKTKKELAKDKIYIKIYSAFRSVILKPVKTDTDILIINNLTVILENIINYHADKIAKDEIN
jgi:hypothetical protein